VLETIEKSSGEYARFQADRDRHRSGLREPRSGCGGCNQGARGHQTVARSLPVPLGEGECLVIGSRLRQDLQGSHRHDGSGCRDQVGQAPRQARRTLLCEEGEVVRGRRRRLGLDREPTASALSRLALSLSFALSGRPEPAAAGETDRPGWERRNGPGSVPTSATNRATSEGTS
jgi:hypothetical protein